MVKKVNLKVSKEVEELSNEVFEFNKTFGDYSRLTYNPYAYELILKEIMKVKEKVLNLEKNNKSKTEFDKLVLKHIFSCITTQEMFADYFSNPKTKYSIIELIDKINGKGTYDYIENTVKEYPFKEQWDRAHSTKHIRLNVVRNDTPEARGMIESLIPNFKQEMLTLGKELGFIPDDYDFEFILLPPFGNPRSNFRIEVNRLELNPLSFICLKEGDNYRIQPAHAYLETAHELLGHGGHNQFSLMLPKCLHLGGMNIANLASKAVAEGIALDRENWGLEHVKKIKESIKLDDNELNAVLINHKIKVAESTWYPFYTILKERELVEKEVVKGEKKKFNVQKYMKQKGFPYYFYRDTRWQSEMHITQAVMELGYIAGVRLVENVRKRIKKEFGEEFVNKEQVLINKTLAMGNWSWEVYEEFVIWYLKEAKGKV